MNATFYSGKLHLWLLCQNHKTKFESKINYKIFIVEITISLLFESISVSKVQKLSGAWEDKNWNWCSYNWISSFFIVSSVRSSSGDHGLIEIQQQQQGHFSKFSNLEQSCLYTFIIHFHFHSVFNVPNRTRQYFCMNYIDNAFMYKFLQDSTRFFRFL